MAPVPLASRLGKGALRASESRRLDRDLELPSHGDSTVTWRFRVTVDSTVTWRFRVTVDVDSTVTSRFRVMAAACPEERSQAAFGLWARHRLGPLRFRWPGRGALRAARRPAGERCQTGPA